MPPTAEWRGSERGQMEQLYTVRCADCREIKQIRATDGILGVELAVKWAREYGWSLGQDRKWRCPGCKGRKKVQNPSPA